ncbi:imelysin family protein [Azospirillum sp. RWY-5-1]|uniref:Imelysin family protein n=1 Tax=Azospirillum oleiclasticum TaxID=2735135 RepID=A0ABX2T8Z9_9PROT|nr:imelysin family protein [Azospirillum oleiclasticum]NYZ12572.1 imelysin family protein [Azospirillum oleiclasticum]NYZ19732.1 imelysin family protein [Azospirillum oleiclasticum]
MNRRTLLTHGLAFGVGAAVLASLPLPALARTADGDRAFLSALLSSHITPRIGTLAATTAGLHTALDRFCAAPDAAGLTAARAAFAAAMDGWAGAQHLRPGPLLLETRTDRFAFWPERRNIVARQLGQILNARDPKLLEPGAIAKQSAAVQGMTALERLLHDDGVTAASFTGGEAGAFRCTLAVAVARNAAAIATEVRDGWAGLAPKLTAGEATPVGANPTEAVNNLYASVVTMTQIVVDQKLLIPLGASAAEAKPGLAEAVRAGRSLAMIAGNLQAIRAIMLGEAGGPGFAALAPDNAAGNAARADAAKAFDAALAAVKAIDRPLDRAIAETRPKVEVAFKAAKAAQTVVNFTLPPLIDVTLGFNELDGD